MQYPWFVQPMTMNIPCGQRRTSPGSCSMSPTVYRLEKYWQNCLFPGVSVSKFMNWVDLPDRVVVGEKLSTACYLPESFVASLYFAWKYDDDFSLGLLQNAKVGGDNCHRAVVVGGVLGIGCGVPRRWLLIWYRWRIYGVIYGWQRGLVFK